MDKRFTISDFKDYKIKQKKISMLTAYDYPFAKIIDESGVDSILVGDSLGMVVLGYEDTTKVTMEDMIHHTKAVSRGTKRALVIADMPFLSYKISKNESIKNAGRLISEGNCSAVKLEGGEEILENIDSIVKSGIPVMGHLGYTPQSIKFFGGHKVQGKTLETAEKILNDAKLLQSAGVFAIVLECIPYKLAKIISEQLEIPTIGIGSGSFCDGQVLVTPDIIGLFKDFLPKHVKKYADIGDTISQIVKNYMQEVSEGNFPTEQHSFKLDDKIIDQILNKIN